MSVAIVTGASAGIGAEIASALAKCGYDLVLINRSIERSKPVLSKLHSTYPSRKVEVVEADLADQDSISQAVQTLLKRTPKISVLFNCAGVLLGTHETSKHGNELHFQVNTLAPYMLMQLLKPALIAGSARVMNVSSGSIAMTGKLRIDDLRNPPKIKKLFGAYAQSKLALTTLTNALANDWRSDGLILRSADPGGTKTGMTRGTGMPTVLRWLQPVFFRTAESAAQELVDSLLDQRFGDETGIYLAKNQIRSAPVDANDPVVQQRLLGLCSRLTLC
jgi:NAD(P)-dependent dehydrogenase (short-subunit alcohol dehydrogenase family)